MNREDIIRMAREAGFDTDRFERSCTPQKCDIDIFDELSRFANAAYAAGAAAEREQHNGPCALQHNTNWKKGAEGHVYLASNFSCSACGYVGLHDAMPTCRRAIRARGNGGGK